MNFVEYMIEHVKPAVFLTFDNDSYDPVSFQSTHQIGNQFTIIDESGNNNHALFKYLPVDGVTESGYKLGQDTLNVEKENALNHSIVFSKDTLLYANKSQSMITIPHHQSLECANSFTVSFFMKRTFGNINNESIKIPIVHKNGIFQINHNHIRGDSDRFEVIVFLSKPDGTQTTVTTYYKFNAFNKPVYMTVRVRSSGFTTYIEIFEDAMLMNSNTVTLNNSMFRGTTPSTMYLCGLPNKIDSSIDDRQRYEFHFDQFSFVNDWLSDTKLFNLFKRILGYTSFTRSMLPDLFIPCNDAQIPDSNTVNVYNSTTLLKPATLTNVYIKGQDGSNRVQNSNSIYIGDKSSLISNTTLNFNKDYTLEFWFKSTNSNKSRLFSCINLRDDAYFSIYPNNGLVINLNYQNGSYKQGGLEVYDSSDCVPINSNSGVNLIDGEFHYIAVVKIGSQLKLFIDGEFQGSTNSPILVNTNKHYFAPLFFDDNNGKESVIGNIMNIAFYSYAVSDSYIATKNSFNIKHIIKGIGTINGSPAVLNVRVHDYETGAVVGEVASQADGKYYVELPNNRLVYLWIYKKFDNTKEPRTIGNLTPITITDGL